VVGYLSKGVISLFTGTQKVKRSSAKHRNSATVYGPQFVAAYRGWGQIEILYNTEFLFIKCNGRSVRVALYRRGHIGFVYMSRMDDVERRGSKYQKMKEDETKQNETNGSGSGGGEQFRGELTKCTFIQQIILVINIPRLDVPLVVFHFNLVKSLLMFGFGRVYVLNLSDLSSNLAFSFHVCNLLFPNSISHKMRNFHPNGCNGPLILAIVRQQNINSALPHSSYFKSFKSIALKAACFATVCYQKYLNALK